ncbi:MAG: hypothetical protein WBD58_11310 [Geitlerinemataceae cyanobacterium]
MIHCKFTFHKQSAYQYLFLRYDTGGNRIIWVNGIKFCGSQLFSL